MKKSRKSVKKHREGKFVSRERAQVERQRLHSVSIYIPSVIDFGDPALANARRIGELLAVWAELEAEATRLDPDTGEA